MQTEPENTRCKHETIKVLASNVNKQFVSQTVHGPPLSSPSYLDDMLHPWGGGCARRLLTSLGRPSSSLSWGAQVEQQGG